MGRTISEKRRLFRSMDERGCFVLPNPWDAGSARLLVHLGFEALATTSSGYARGRPAGQTIRSRAMTFCDT
jgi:2-methylisocitrate lyase-like PEP mutase family enzyme